MTPMWRQVAMAALLRVSPSDVTAQSPPEALEVCNEAVMRRHHDAIDQGRAHRRASRHARPRHVPSARPSSTRTAAPAELY